jgi:hypothetical protein
MDMIFWLPQTGATLAQVEGQSRRGGLECPPDRNRELLPGGASEKL